MSTTISSPAAVSAPKVPALGRIQSIDILRGLVMVIMALDHTRDYFTHLRFEPENLAQTWYALFFTRWITHFCAPLFFFLAGTGAFFYGLRRTPSELSRFLWTRGLWLIVLEFTVVGTAWTFQFPFGIFGVIWALGASMVIMAAAVRMPVRWLGVISALVILTHNLLDGIRPERFGSLSWLWTILHVRGFVFLPFQIPEFILFQIIPWVAVMGAGYALGSVYLLESDRRRKLITRLGLVLTFAFVLLRATNLYGNPPVGQGGVSQGDWHIQPTLEKTVILFFDVEKYPPSLQFLLMTLGPSLLLLAWLDKKTTDKLTADKQTADKQTTGKTTPQQPAISGLASALDVFGRVPLFFYVLHLYLIHALAVVVALLFHQPDAWLLHGAFFRNRIPSGYGHNLPFIYLMWITAVVILYFPCRWFMGVKQRRKDWWLSYL
jgi:uncharacterized membrane protein